MKMPGFDARILITHSRDLLGCNLGESPFIFSIIYEDPCKEDEKRVPVEDMSNLIDLIIESTDGCKYVSVRTANTLDSYPVSKPNLRALRRSVSKVSDCVGSARFRFSYGF